MEIQYPQRYNSSEVDIDVHSSGGYEDLPLGMIEFTWYDRVFAYSTKAEASVRFEHAPRST